jgi:hypothetical protein
MLILEQANRYRYDKLSNEDGSFRLLEIQPASNIDALIECRLHAAHIERARNKFEALSYQWGAPGRGLVISLDGQEFRIQRNLWLFLRQLRRYNHLFVWVDAICINQNDILERGSQVQLMNRIYPSASRVLVWLGDGADDSDPAFHFLQYVDQALDDAAIEMIPGVYRSLFRDDDETHIWLALQKLCARDYWTRLWIIQEVLLAQELILFCGDRSLTWDAFKFACAGPASVKGFAGLHAIDSAFGPVHAAKMAMSRSQFRELSHQRALQRPRYLNQLLEAYGNANCTDARDRIYGLLGLSRDWSGDNGINIDYSRTELSLLIDTLCISQNIDRDPLKFGHLVIRALHLDQAPCGFSTNFGNAVASESDTEPATAIEETNPMVSSNAPWLDDVFSFHSTGHNGSTVASPAGPRIWTPTTLSLARATYKKIEIALRRRVGTVFMTPGITMSTKRFTTNTNLTAYTHHPIMDNDLIFSLPDTAIGLIYRPASPTMIRYVGWALPEAALNAIDPFWVSDTGIEESTKFLNRMGKYHEIEVKVSGDTVMVSVEVSVWDMLFLMACNPVPKGTDKAMESRDAKKGGFWWGKGMPIVVPSEVSPERGGNGLVDVRGVGFREPDRQWERRQRSLRY